MHSTNNLPAACVIPVLRHYHSIAILKISKVIPSPSLIIEDRNSFKDIACFLCKDPTTILKEMKFSLSPIPKILFLFYNNIYF